MTIFVGDVELQLLVCNTCGITFAAPEKWCSNRMYDKKTFYCPNGDKLWYPQETEEAKLKRRLADEQRCCITAREDANKIERRLIAYKGVVTKLKKHIG